MKVLQSAEQPPTFGGSHSSPQSTIPFPHVSVWQVAEQPSHGAELPSSQVSPSSTTPFPQISTWHVAEQTKGVGGSHCSPASTFLLPQTGGPVPGHGESAGFCCSSSSGR